MTETNLVLNPIFDIPVDNVDKPIKFYVLSGSCKKCNLSDGLIYTGIKANKKSKISSLVKTYCICCGAKEVYFSGNIVINN